MKPRDYQDFGVSAVWQWFRENPTGHPIVKMPTGTGKSIVIAELIRQAFKWQSSCRIMMLTTSQTLIEQNFDKLVKIWPTAPVGLYSAGLNKRERYMPVTFAGIQSVADKADIFGHIDLILIDECDRVPDDMKSQYRKFIAELTKKNKNLRCIGFTATDWRTGTGLITESDNALFTDVAVDMCTIEAYNWFMDEGYFVRLRTKRTKLHIEAKGVKVTAGEYNMAQLERAVNKRDITEAAVRETLEEAEGRRKWLVFCAGIHHVIDTTEILNYFGVEARAVHSKAPKQAIANIKWFREYKGDGPVALVNNDVLTVGFDDPEIDLLMILRPSKSSRLWVQILGRGTRPLYAEGFDLQTTLGRLMAIAASPKQDCLVMDYAKNVVTLGPINDPVIPYKKGKGGPQPAPVKLCECCDTYVHASLRKCNTVITPATATTPEVKCGFEFPETIKIGIEATTKEVIKLPEPPIVEIFRVDSVNYTVHTKNSTAKMLKVRYYCGIKSFDDYVCIEHPQGSFAQRKAAQWWAKRSLGGAPMPSTVEVALALADRLKNPTHLSVHVNAKYPTITDYCFDGSEFNRHPIADPAHLVAPEVYISNGRTSLIKQRQEAEYDLDQY